MFASTGQNIQTIRLAPLSDLRRMLSSIATLTFQYPTATSLALLLPCVWLFRRQLLQQERRRQQQQIENEPGRVSDTIGIDAVATDPSLLKKFTAYSSYTVESTGYTYSYIRTFYREHPQGDKLPTKPKPLPLLVFVHGLGGSVAQFHALISSLTNAADCLGVDLPGCGLSRFAPRDWNAYTTESLVQLLAVVINKHRKKDLGQDVVLICHSMGCSLGALLASTTSPFSELLSRHVQGLVAICPVAEPPTETQVKQFRKLLMIPGPVFDLWRRWDRRGGTESTSVARFTGLDADEETKKLQVRFNEQSRTPVWRRMAYGTLPAYEKGEPTSGLPGTRIWAGLHTSVFLVAGEADPITKAENVTKIASYLGHNESKRSQTSEQQNSSLQLPLTRTEIKASQDSTSDSQSPATNTTTTNQPAFRTLILPAPASHALLYDHRTSRPLAGHIASFLTTLDPRLSQGWQLHHLNHDGKWDVKNLAKWSAVTPVSLPIGGIFRAMKTLREVDDVHTPAVFVREWRQRRDGKDGLGAVGAVLDISHETPVYDAAKLTAGSVAYHKFPTVSKMPPTRDEVRSFVDVVDRLRGEMGSDGEEETATRFVAVHCHYGFNRTGFFIIAYLVEGLRWGLEDAIRAFAEARPPGVRHAHFVDELYARYGMGVRVREGEKG